MITLLLAIFFCQHKKLKLKWSYQQIIKKVQTKKSRILTFENKQYEKYT